MTQDQLFDRALQFVLKWEAGYVNHPSDSGGPTNKGITQKTYDQWRERVGSQKQSVKNITDQEVQTIYKEQYWAWVYNQTHSDALNIALFDFAVLAGPSRAMKVASMIKNDASRFLLAREDYFRAIAKGKNQVFLKGWINRNNALRKYLNL